MTVYKNMYLRLFSDVTTAIEFLKEQDYSNALKTLITAQQETEEIFISEESKENK